MCKLGPKKTTYFSCKTRCSTTLGVSAMNTIY